MRHIYSEWDGSEFPSPRAAQGMEGFFDFILAYGEEGLEALKHARLDPEQQELLDKLIADGLLEKMGARWRLTPRAISRMQRRALMEIFRNLRGGTSEGHETTAPGRSGERTTGTRPYGFGDPTSELDTGATLRNALTRVGPGLPLRIAERDFEVHISESLSTTSLVILLDMSGSMMRYGRFMQAKKAAMAVHALVQQQFPRDTVDIVGFHSTAEVIPAHRLPLVSPKPITLHDPIVRLRIPLAEAEKGPPHFTNLQMGLMLARQILRRRGGQDRQMLIITDGEPTAHVEGDELCLLYPPQKATTMATLKEAFALSRQGIRVATFALIDDYAYMDWVGFVDRLTKLTRGVAFYCHSGGLAGCVMESYLSGRRRKTYFA